MFLLSEIKENSKEDRRILGIIGLELGLELKNEESTSAFRVRLMDERKRYEAEQKEKHRAILLKEYYKE